MPRDTRVIGRPVTIKQAPILSGTMLQGRYCVVGQLGKGGMGAVYEAVDQRLEATVALKETFAVDERLRRQFEQEARLLAQLSHPALPKVTDYFTEDDRAFLVMQFISGVDLAEIIAKQPGPFPRSQVVAWADQLLDALVFLHSRERQIIHRDIKPHNLKLTPNGTIALLDFGLAKAEASDMASGDPSIYGYTRRYAPLEQIQDQGTTPQSDIYALGATLYHLLTGMKPADAVVREAARVMAMPDPLRPANEVNPAVGKDLASVLSCAMAQCASDRYADANEFRIALAKLGRNGEKIGEDIFERVEQIPSEPIPGPAIQAATSKAERLRTTDAFESYSILKPEEPALFTSPSSNRSNIVIGGMLLAMMLGLVGLMYGYRLWNESLAPISTRQSPTTLQNKSKFAGANNQTSSVPISSTRESVSPNLIISDTRNSAKEKPVARPEGISPKPAGPQVNPSEQTGAAKLSAPNMRMPRTDLKEYDPVPSTSRLPAFGVPR